MKVLIVDPTKSERARLVDALCELTNVVVLGAVEDGRSALHALAETSPDVLVTGGSLGDEDDVALIAEARRSTRPPMIVVFASDDTPARRERCLAAGADRYLGKQAGVVALQRAVVGAGLVRRSTQRIPDAARLELLGRVAAGAAHDLNNYLGVVDVSLALLRKRLPGAEHEELDLLRRAVERASRLTSCVLTYARGGTPPTQPVDLDGVVRRILELFGRAISQEVEIALDLADVPPVRGVEIELEQLVLNLVLNASEAMPRGGRLQIGLHPQGSSRVRLVISDTGRGLSADARPLDRLDRHGGGLGLGIVRSIVESHGGKLRVTLPPERGTQVEVELDAIVAS